MEIEADAVLDAEDLAERARHRAPAGAAGQHQRSVDVEQNQFGHDQNFDFTAIVLP